jgi:DNA-binding SARP family transcriptional activator/tetratricopeptide (TPR) repeat protein
MTVAFRVLGPVEAEIDGRPVDLGHARQRCVLSALLVDAGRLVPVATLLERVWAGQPPQRARPVLSGYLSRLRSLLVPAAEVALTRRSGGYLLAVDPMSVDMHWFRCLVRQAGAASGDAAAALFDQALALWRGEAFATLDTPWLEDVRDSLGAERLAAELDRTDIALDRGQHAAVLAELTERAAANPLDERLAGQLILALYRSGRQGDALCHYERLRRLLADELGVDPGPSLRQLHQRILTADPAVAARPAITALRRQLPAAPESFTGRTAELDRLDTILAVSEESPTTVAVCVVSGTAGVGKTALTLHWAHRVADRFRDGQLYVNLRGFDPGGSVLSPDEALRTLLEALDIPSERIPARPEAQAALYRSVLAGRRTLLVLDNARDVGQLRPLLPGTPGCLVMVTSRDQLTGLIAGHGAQVLPLQLLTMAEARRLLARRLGQRRVAAEPQAVNEIVIRCARLPLALAVAAARAATRPHLTLAALANDLRRNHSALDALADVDPTIDLRAVLSWSYGSLSPDAALLFRLLAVHPGPDISVAAAASVVGVTAVRARALLAELAGAHLVTEHLLGRYLMHDLLRAYAAELAQTHSSGTERRDAVRRMLDHYLHTAHTAARQLDPHRGHEITLGPAADRVSTEEPDSYDRAVAWFDAERAVLLAAIDLAARDGAEVYTWPLVWTLAEYLHRQGHWQDWVIAGRTALDAAQRVGDRSGEAISHRGLGSAHAMLAGYDDADEHYRCALDLYAPDDHVGQAHTRHNLAVVCIKQQRITDALGHVQEALRLYRIAEHRHGEVKSLNSVGYCHTLLGNHHEAITCCRQALSLYVELGDRHGEAGTWHSLGYAHHQLRQPDRATDCYRRALDLFRDLGSRYHEAEALADLGDAHAAAGDLNVARTSWRMAMAILTELDHPEAERVRAKLDAESGRLAGR